MTVFKLLLKIVVAPVIVLLTLFVWTCVALVYVSGLVLGLASMVIALLGVAVLVTYSPQNGLILLLIAVRIFVHINRSHIYKFTKDDIKREDNYLII